VSLNSTGTESLNRIETESVHKLYSTKSVAYY
jgi:hypothetical protein